LSKFSFLLFDFLPRVRKLSEFDGYTGESVLEFRLVKLGREDGMLIEAIVMQIRKKRIIQSNYELSKASRSGSGAVILKGPLCGCGVEFFPLWQVADYYCGRSGKKPVRTHVRTRIEKGDGRDDTIRASTDAKGRSIKGRNRGITGGRRKGKSREKRGRKSGTNGEREGGGSWRDGKERAQGLK
jgi:hypothetical protein